MEKQASLFIFITDNCNLKCLGCMQSCDRIVNPYYMTIEELEDYLKVLSQNNFTINNKQIQTIHLTGGDPLTHPDLIKFCELIHAYQPELGIDISTNGLLLNKFTDSQLHHLCRCQVVFQLSLYADINLLKMYKKIIERFKRLNIHMTLGGGSHFFFSKQDKTILQADECRGYREECQKRLNNQDHVILYKGKVYSCWNDINIIQKENLSNKTDNNNFFNKDILKELMENKEHYYCNICKCANGSGGEEFILWQHHNKQAKEVFNSNLKELFVYNYPLYYSLQHDCNKHLEVLQDELFKQFLSENQFYYINTRFLKGKGDIFIPFSNTISNKLENFLKNIEDIEQYNIYLVSVHSSPEIEKEIYSRFTPFCREDKLNNYFLKANSLFDAYKTFLNNSYLNNKFIIDINQYNFELLPLK